jgi:hypothetical protein
LPVHVLAGAVELRTLVCLEQIPVERGQSIAREPGILQLLLDFQRGLEALRAACRSHHGSGGALLSSVLAAFQSLLLISLY